MRKIKVGVTGGIGSGKSTVCRIFECLGVPVYYSDKRAREFINTHPDTIALYSRLFGKSVYENGKLYAKKVAAVLFQDKSIMKEIQDHLHPLVRQDFATWADQQTSRIVINEAAVLFESGGARFMDEIISVVAPEELRIRRVMSRDGSTEQEILNRLNNQWKDHQRIALSQHIIYADDKRMVIPQVLVVYNDLINRVV
jgi:dephospho-CoA kinase